MKLLQCDNERKLRKCANEEKLIRHSCAERFNDECLYGGGIVAPIITASFSGQGISYNERVRGFLSPSIPFIAYDGVSVGPAVGDFFIPDYDTPYLRSIRIRCRNTEVEHIFPVFSELGEYNFFVETERQRFRVDGWPHSPVRTYNGPNPLLSTASPYGIDNTTFAITEQIIYGSINPIQKSATWLYAPLYGRCPTDTNCTDYFIFSPPTDGAYFDTTCPPTIFWCPLLNDYIAERVYVPLNSLYEKKRIYWESYIANCPQVDIIEPRTYEGIITTLLARVGSITVVWDFGRIVDRPLTLEDYGDARCTLKSTGNLIRTGAYPNFLNSRVYGTAYRQDNYNFFIDLIGGPEPYGNGIEKFRNLSNTGYRIFNNPHYDPNCNFNENCFCHSPSSSETNLSLGSISAYIQRF